MKRDDSEERPGSRDDQGYESQPEGVAIASATGHLIP
jgi:hypothetical protein